MPPAAPAAPTTSAQAMQNLSGYQASMKTPDQASADANTAAGVSGAQTAATGLQGAVARTTALLNNVAPSVMGRTANSLVTDAQATRQIGNESAPIQADLTKNTNDYNTAETNLHDAQTEADAKAANTLSAQNGQMSYLQNLYNNLYTQEQDKAKSDQSAAVLAEQAREFNATPHGSTSSGGLDLSGLSSLLGGNSGGGSQPTGTLGRNAAGGYSVTDANGKPITLGQYYDANGGGVNDVLKALASGSASDKVTAQKIQQGIASGMYNSDSLARLYPQIFGG